MTIKSHLLSHFLIAVVLTGCGSEPPDPCDNCAAWSDLVDACLDEWSDEYQVVPDCHKEFDSAWFNDMGLLNLDDATILEAYISAGTECTSGDEAYDSCKAQNAVSREVVEAAGNGEARDEVCLEETNSGVELAMAALDCKGFLVAAGIPVPE